MAIICVHDADHAKFAPQLFRLHYRINQKSLIRIYMRDTLSKSCADTLLKLLYISIEKNKLVKYLLILLRGNKIWL